MKYIVYLYTVNDFGIGFDDEIDALEYGLNSGFCFVIYHNGKLLYRHSTV
jgi:hypothetical protein